MIIPNLILAAAIGAQPIPAPPLPSAAPSGASESARALGSLPTLFSSDDYPAAARRHDEQGTVAFRLAVSREGRVTGCTVTSSSGSASLDSTTCSILQRRARFAPARDAQGKAVEDQFSGRIRWELPPREPLLVENAQSRFVFPINPAGEVTGCTFETSRAVAGRDSCPIMRDVAGRILRAIPASLSLSGRELVLERQTIVGSGDLGENIGSAAGEMLLRSDRAMLTIDASGETIECRMEGSGALTPTQPPSCAAMSKGPYVPLQPDVSNRGERRMAIIQAAYLRPETP